MANQKRISEMSYEAAVARLEEVVRALETGEITLDESLEMFQEGIGLVRYCHRQLDAIEAKVQTLIDSPNGVVAVEEQPKINVEVTVGNAITLFEEGE